MGRASEPAMEEYFLVSWRREEAVRPLHELTRLPVGWRKHPQPDVEVYYIKQREWRRPYVQIHVQIDRSRDGCIEPRFRRDVRQRAGYCRLHGRVPDARPGLDTLRRA
ncbi:hypothetical protein MPLB_1690079 [Mesorhizobium sp. ORS 3324]|nr:hypothetical protein MPLB_1690079 [Mesorhizobium sp. ORS 3324]